MNLGGLVFGPGITIYYLKFKCKFELEFKRCLFVNVANL